MKNWFFSAVLHISVILGLFLIKSQHKSSVEPKVVQVKFVNSKLSNDIRIVRVDPKTNNLAPDRTKLVHKGQFNQRAEVNTIPKNLGSLKNNGDPNSEAKIIGTDGFLNAPKSVLNGQGKTIDPNSGSNLIPGAQIGVKTLINSEKYVYFSFYDRINKRLTPIWKPEIIKLIERQKNTSNQLIQGTFVTSLNVIINPDGSIMTIFVSQSSGFESFDQLAIKSFRAIEPLNHPPKELIKNGAMTLKWDFTIIATPTLIKDTKVRWN